MGDDRLFSGLLRLLIRRMKAAVEALKRDDKDTALEIMQGIITDLQNTLEH